MINLNIRRSFSAKISLWVLLLAVPTFFVSLGLLYRQSRQMVREESVERANGVLHASMHRICRYLVSNTTVTEAYSWKVEQSMQAEKLLSLTNNAVNLNPYVDACSISLEPGVLKDYPDQFMAYSVREGDSIISSISRNFGYFNKAWYQEPLEKKKPKWVVFYDETNALQLDKDGMIATYSQPLYGPDSTIVGVMSTAISLIHLSKIVSNVHAYPNSYFFMIDEKGRYVGHPDTSRLFRKTIFNVADPQEQQDLIALGYEMTQGHMGQMSVVVNGEPSLVCYQPVPMTSWSLAIVCPDSDILEGYNKLTYILCSLLIVGLLLIVLNCYKVVKLALRPLSKLKEKSQAIAEGDLEVDITQTNRGDVVGRLQSSFATMLESLKNKLDSVHAASREVQQYNSELEHATQLVVEADKQKTLFMQNMTHQVRTPLNILVGFAQILTSQSNEENSALTDEEIKNIAGMMDDSSKQLNRMVLMLYDSSDKGLQESSQCDKNEIVYPNEVVRIVAQYVMDVSPGVLIGFESEVPDTFSVKTNQKLLAYSVSEIIFNAVKYSDREHIVVRIVLTDRTIRFIVEDTGRGIAEADRNRIFMFFTKVDDYSEGLGLGLPLAKSHANVLGGDCMLDPDYHDGCRFIFELPLR